MENYWKLTYLELATNEKLINKKKIRLIPVAAELPELLLKVAKCLETEFTKHGSMDGLSFQGLEGGLEARFHR